MYAFMCACMYACMYLCHMLSISGLVVEYIVAIDVTRVRFPADAFFGAQACQPAHGFIP